MALSWDLLHCKKEGLLPEMEDTAIRLLLGGASNNTLPSDLLPISTGDENDDIFKAGPEYFVTSVKNKSYKKKL